MPRAQYTVDHERDAHRRRIIIQVGGAGFVMGLPFGFSTAMIVGAGFTVLGLVVYRIVVVGSADLIAGAVLPDRRGFAGQAYSHIEAMQARGDIDAALTAWEVAISESPTAFAARTHAADLYARSGRDPRRAAALLREVRDHPRVPAEAALYANQRLIDLYLGPLNDPGRAMVELRRLADRFDGTTEARGALQALRALKAEQRDVDH